MNARPDDDRPDDDRPDDDRPDQKRRDVGRPDPRRTDGERRDTGSGRIRHGGAPRARAAGSGARRSVQRPSERRRSADPARQLAFEVMRAVSEGAYANLELPRVLRRAKMRGRDAAFVTELVYGATRLRGRYDPIIARCAGRELADIDPAALDVLRLGAHQLLGMRVPTHAAVGETVSLARGELGTGISGFVNAVLRRISEKSPEQWHDISVRDLTDNVDRLAYEHSHPAWIVRAMRAALLGHGASTPESVDADLVALLEADNAAPTVSLVARPGLVEVAELVRAGATASTLSPVGAVLADGGDPGSIAAVRDSRAAVQDEGSQLLALALAQAHPSEPAAEGEKWLDLCAGPGGKAALLAALAIPRHAVLFANEISEHRTELVQNAIAAAVDAGAEVMVGTGDGRTLGQDEPDTFDRVLVDAPCTGLGALRRRPEARWRRTPQDISELTTLQGDLLDSALAAVRPGGLVGYATCSPHLAETRYVVTDALKRRDDVEILDAREWFRDASGEVVHDLGEGPFVQLWPHVHGTDAMFFALLRKNG